jgi:hypothetical protein
VRHPSECFPCFRKPIAVHRILGLLHDFSGQCQNRARGRHRPPGAVQATETLPERIERSGLGHETVEIEIYAHLETLRCNNEERAGRRVTDGFTMNGKERLVAGCWSSRA